ncbi:MAG: GIY-YIG nuclease family protein [Bacteroidia bacterium]|nr:GIY-YIG nuclease family protein [Bacteroidia bacterium]
MFSIIDVETTGGSFRQAKITEIAILLHDGNKITDRFETLINPGMAIPWFITRLTGIDDSMVKNAPKFHEVAKMIVELTENRILVAHNSKFDYGFLQHEYHALGYKFLRNTFCTCTVSRKLFPGLHSYGLENLSRHFNIENKSRHRAAGDAEATSVLLEKIIEVSGLESVNSYLIPWNRNNKLPASITPDELHSLPHTAGVYFFKDESGKIIYAGKAVNLNRRVLSHFSNTRTGKVSKTAAHAHSFSYEVTGSELIALLRETEVIKSEMPILNRAQKNTNAPIGIFKSLHNGYLHLETGSVFAGNMEEPVLQFSKSAQALRTLEKMAQEFELCASLCHLEEEKSSGCFGYQIKQCRGACAGKENAGVYNKRVERALNAFAFSMKDLLIIDDGRTPDEKSAVLIRNGKYEGYGFFNPEFSKSVYEIIDCIKPHTFYPESLSIIHSFIKKKKVKVIELQQEASLKLL